MSKRNISIAGLLALFAVFVAGFGHELLIGSSSRAISTSPATFVGSETCAGCHRVEADLWRGSQHERAMQHASDNSVRGDFNDASFDYYGVHSRFFRKDGKYLVESDGADGTLATFEVKYTFGVDPLQQYLVEFPDGRLQALSLAWDTRPRERGGQRWFHLYPNEDIKYDDVLHWTKLNQNWNFMCAGCHSTGVHKNYDATNDRFATTWTEISVGCEACHGQGSVHVTWARDQQSWWPFARGQQDRAKGLLVRFDERRDVVWRHDASSGQPRRNFPPALLRKEVETCGFCHSRGSEFAEDWVPGRPLSDTHVVAPLVAGLYYADGQMRDEVYNYGSFKQSKMFAAGVTCGDCHEPHGARLRVAGDGVCLQCHAPEKYAAATTHSHHEGVGPPVACSACHMASSAFMVVDRRHDHSFRVPRPDISAKLGTPNACNGCHAEKSAQWAAAAVERWYGAERKGFQKYAEAFQAAWNSSTDAGELLAAVASDPDAPAYVRASALGELAPYLSSANFPQTKSGLADRDPMVRIGALNMLENAPALEIWPLVSPLLSDSSRGVRIRAAALLAAVPTANQPTTDRESFERAAAEFVAAQRLNADRPEARATLGNFFTRRGRVADAKTEYEAALRLSPQYAPAAINLADLYRQQGTDADAERVLRTTIAASPNDAGLRYALGLTLTRLKQPQDASLEFRRATVLEPNRARYAYASRSTQPDNAMKQCRS
jgi:predicted CXXCH cytochrome family protein